MEHGRKRIIPESLIEKARKLKSGLIPFPYSVSSEFAMKYNEAMSRQWWSREEIEDYRMSKLRALLKFASMKVPYYAKMFRERGFSWKDAENPEDLTKIPVLTKDMVRKHRDELKAVNFDTFNPVRGYTSGTTGTVMEFYLTRELREYERVFVERHLRWAGVPHNARTVVLRGDIISKDTGEKAPYRVDGNTLYISSFHLSNENFGFYYKLMKDFRPVFMRAYPSALAVFTGLAASAGEGPVDSVKTIVTSSETMLEGIRKKAEEFWQCNISDWYGNGERTAGIGQCELNSYHINEDYSFVELLPVEGSGMFRIVGTNYYNYAMPLIRYETGDLLELPDSPESGCDCGRNFRVVKKILGRVEDLIVTPEGRFVGRLDAAFLFSPGIRLSQIVQHEKDSIEVKIVRDAGFSENDMENLEEQLRFRLGDGIAIKYRFVEDIPVTPGGKLKFVISDLSVGKKFRVGEN